jgi:serine/threonine protein kinase
MLRKDGLVKIVDFGLARDGGPVGSEASSRGGSGTISGTLSGTLLYMPPEILRGETATTASDVFSLGAILYELTTGQHPFAGPTRLDVLEAIECRPVEPISSLRNGVTHEVDRLILRMLDRRLGGRPSAREVCDVLGAVSGL